MGDSFQDVVVLRADDKLELRGEAIIIGGTGTEAQSVIFSNGPGSVEGHLAWNPAVNRTLSLPDASGTIILSGQAVAGIGVSTIGNTVGQTGTLTGVVVLAASNGITLSQATSAGGGTITALGKKPRPILFFGTGRYRVASGVDVQEAGDSFTIAYVVLRREIAGISGTTLIDVLKNGVSIWNVTPGNRPSITAASGDDQRVTAIPDVVSIASTDRLEVEIVEVETGSPQDLVVELVST